MQHGPRLVRRVNAEVQTRLRPLLGEAFELDGRRYPYFLHRRSDTWRSERIVELALAKALLEEWAGRRLLEIGNVVSPYLGGRHCVVDKYERVPGVISDDAETFTADPFEAILSISTMEHIGWDETPRDAQKIPRVIDHLYRDLLKPGGTFTMTVPHGYNRDLDDLIASGRLPFDSVSYLKRVSRINHWEQVEQADLATTRYGFPYLGANAVVVASLTR